MLVTRRADGAGGGVSAGWRRCARSSSAARRGAADSRALVHGTSSALRAPRPRERPRRVPVPLRLHVVSGAGRPDGRRHPRRHRRAASRADAAVPRVAGPLAAEAVAGGHAARDRIFTVSRGVAAAAVARTSAFPRRSIAVVPEAPDPVFGPRSAEASTASSSPSRPRHGGRFLVYAGGVSPHKSVDDAARAPTRALEDPTLPPRHRRRARGRDVPVVGRRPCRARRSTSSASASASLLPGFVPDETLACLYRRRGGRRVAVAGPRASGCRRWRRRRAGRRSCSATSRRTVRRWATPACFFDRSTTRTGWRERLVDLLARRGRPRPARHAAAPGSIADGLRGMRRQRPLRAVLAEAARG